MKKYLVFFYGLEKKIWGDKVDSNPYFATISILFIALIAALIAGAGMLDLDNVPVSVLLGVASLFLVGNMYESIIATSSYSVAAGRIGLWIILTALLTLLAVVATVIVIAIVVIYLLISLLFGMIGGGSSAGKKYSGYDSSGNKVELEDTGFGTARDQHGREWENKGGNEFELKD